MYREPPDADGLFVPDVQPARAWPAVQGLRAAASIGAQVGQRLASSQSEVVAWAGTSSDRYRHRRAEVSGRVADVADIAARSAVIVLAWLNEASAALAEMRLAREEVKQAQARQNALEISGHYPNAHIDQAADDAWLRWNRAKRSYWDGLSKTANQLTALRDQVTGHPLDLTDNTNDFFGAMKNSVVDPFVTAWSLTGAAFFDEKAWQDRVTALPGQTWAGITHAITHPGDFLGRQVDADGWQHGRYGEAGASVAILLLPRPKWLDLPMKERPIEWARHMADPKAPLPRLQTIDEMIEDVDLNRHEHFSLGHTIRRHVDVGVHYLRDRLTHGTLLDTGERGYIPPYASEFADIETANKYATQVLRANEKELREFAAGTGRSKVFKLTVDAPAGRVMNIDGDDFALTMGSTITLQMSRDANGIFIKTMYIGS